MMRFSTMKHMKRDQGGATAVEFALIVPLFLLIFMGALEFGLVFYLRSAVEEVTRIAARQAITGSTYDADENQSRTQFINSGLRSGINALTFQPNNFNLQTRVYDTITDYVNNNNATSRRYGRANQLVEYTVTYNHDFITPFAGIMNLFENPVQMDGQLTITSTAFGQNENNGF